MLLDQRHVLQPEGPRHALDILGGDVEGVRALRPVVVGEHPNVIVRGVARDLAADHVDSGAVEQRIGLGTSAPRQCTPREQQGGDDGHGARHRHGATWAGGCGDWGKVRRPGE